MQVTHSTFTFLKFSKFALMIIKKSVLEGIKFEVERLENKLIPKK